MGSDTRLERDHHGANAGDFPSEGVATFATGKSLLIHSTRTFRFFRDVARLPQWDFGCMPESGVHALWGW